MCPAVVAVLLLIPLAASAEPPDPSRVTARQAPAWVRDGVVYEVYPRVFSPQGHLAGVTSRLGELKDLGVTIVWLMPIHPIGREKAKGSVGSPYAVRDYYAVNPDYGTMDDLRRLVAEAHRLGLKVILDVVANHTSWDSVLMKHPDFYTRDAQGRMVSPYDWSDVADLDYGNPRLREYMLGVLRYWVREADVDGYRCDVAAMVPTDFWERARAEIEKVKPDVAMLAEADAPELLVKAFDFDYAWPFHSALTDVLMGRKPATAIREVWEEERRRYPKGALHMRFSDNHDERRAIARFGERGALAASALVFTLDGVPMLYNGMEVGDTTESGAPALFERLPVFWLSSERRPEFPRFYREIIALRRASGALRRGETVWLRNSDEERVVSFLRRGEGEEIVVALNLSSRPVRGTVEAAGGFSEITPGAAGPAALPAVALEAWGFRIFRRALP